MTEILLEDVLKELNFSMEEFIDFCILCGCDYLPTIQGLGPGNALKLIKEYRSLERIIEHINQENEKRLLEGEKP